MTYRGVSGNNKKLGISPTEEDRSLVYTLARMKLGVVRIGVLMGERYGLGKPMSRMALYYHHREDLRLGKAGLWHSWNVNFRWDQYITEIIERLVKNGA